MLNGHYSEQWSSLALIQCNTLGGERDDANEHNQKDETEKSEEARREERVCEREKG